MNDIYMIEARRRFDASETSAIAILSDTLRELNWQPPVDPDEAAVNALMVVIGKEQGWPQFNIDQYAAGTLKDDDWRIALAAYRAGKAAGDAA